MQDNEIIYEENEFTEDEVTETSKPNGWLIAAGVAAVAAVGYGIYRGGKAIVNKIKAKKAEKAGLIQEVDLDDADASDDN